MNDSTAQIGVMGAGAFGTAMAQALAGDGSQILMWAREPELVDEINEHHTNTMFLPSARLSSNIRATNDLAELGDLPVLLAVVPSQFLGRVIADLPDRERDLVLCSKGIEAGTGRLMTEVAREAAPSAHLAVISGPTFAHEVAAGLPTAVTLACTGGREQWQRLSPSISRPAFRPYYSSDLIGSEIGGAVKNVLAIACGVVDGLALGQNARAALISRGFAEMLRFGMARGAQRDTLAGLCGLGDLVLTCSSTSSRNFSLGKALGEGMTAAEALSGKTSVAEGAATAPVLAELASRDNIEMPVVDAVCRLLAGEASAREAVSELLARPLRAEQDFVA